MARKRYPSDDERLKRPAGVVIGFSVMTPDPDHPGHAVVFQDPEKRGIWTGLLLVAGHGFAGRTEDRVTLSDALLSWCTGRAQRRHALSSLRAVCELMEYTVSDRGHSVVVHVKNLSQNQGWTPQATRSAPGTPSAPEVEVEDEFEVDVDSKRAKKPPPDHATKTAGLLAELLRSRRPGARVPKKLEVWAKDIAQIEDQPDRIAEVVRWLYSPANEGEFRIEVQSGSGLVKKYGKTLAAMERHANRGNGEKRTPGQQRLDRMAEAVRESEERDRARFERQRNREAAQARITDGAARTVPEG